MLPRIVIILFIRLNTNIIIFKAIYNIGFIFPFFIIYIFIGINIITNIQIAITSVIFILKIELNRKIKQKNNKKPINPTIALYINEKTNNIIFFIFSLCNNFPTNKLIKVNIKSGMPKIANNSITSPQNSIKISYLQITIFQ